MAETNTAVPAAPAPATPAPQSNMTTAQPAQPKSPAPPLPKAQEQSTPAAAKTQPTDQKPKVKAERPAPTPEESATKLAEEMFAPKEAAPEPAKAPETPKAAPDTPKAEKAPPAAPVAEKSPFAGMELPENATPTEIANFRKMKETYEAVWQKAQNDRVAVASLTKELETYKKATPADTAEAQRLKTELQSAQDRLAVYDVSSHPDFQRQYTAPKKKALDEANMLLSDNAIPNAPDMASLLSLPRAEFAKKVSELAASLPAFDQGSLVANMREAYRLNGEEKGALSKAGELKQNLAAKAAQEARNAFEASKQEFASKIPELTIPEGADEEMITDIRGFNQARLSAMQEAEHATFGQMNERQVADAMIQAANLKVVTGHLLPNLMKQRAKLEKLVAEQHAELTAIKGKKNPGSFTAAEPPSATDTSKMDPRQLAEHMFKS